jgi:hypothetical protein
MESDQLPQEMLTYSQIRPTTGENTLGFCMDEFIPKTLCLLAPQKLDPSLSNPTTTTKGKYDFIHSACS